MNNIQKFRRYARTHGPRAALRASLRKLLTGRADGAPPQDGIAPESAGTTPKSAAIGAKIDVIGFYMDILGAPHGSAADLEAANPSPNTLQWVIPNFGFGSGGHQNIFRFMNNLAALGYQNRLVILPPHDWPDGASAARTIAEWYEPLKAEVALGVEGFKPCHATIATGWQTAYQVAKYQATRDRFYFVQDFEPSFYPMSSEYVMAENTYRLGLKGITAGTWLADKLAADYGMKTGAVSFSSDLSLYKPAERRKEDHFNIVFYARHVTKRRMFELGMCALDLVCKRHPEVTVIFIGGDVDHFRIPFTFLNGGEMRVADLPPLFQQCDLGLVLSGTNLSLMPLELGACKKAVVMNDSPSSRWLMGDDAAFFAPDDPHAMASVICEAIEKPALREAKAQAAYDLVQKTSWKKEASKMAKLLDTL